MMDREYVCRRIQEIGIIPSIRVSSAADAIFAAREIMHAGIPIVEVTMTVPGAADIIAQLVKEEPAMIVGAGTVNVSDHGLLCAEAGAAFLTSPGLDLKLVEFAHARNITVFPGALTPTEIMMARNAGADFIKIFPCSEMGGPRYIRDLHGPFPDIRLIASGGVGQENAGEYILAGAKALGVGAAVIPHEAVQLRQPHRIRELSRRILQSVADARARLAYHEPA